MDSLVLLLRPGTVVQVSESSGYTRTRSCHQFFLKKNPENCMCSKLRNKQIHANHLTVVHSQQLLTSQIRWPLMLPKVLCFLAELCCCTSREWKKRLLVPFHTKCIIYFFQVLTCKNCGIYMVNDETGYRIEFNLQHTLERGFPHDIFVLDVTMSAM